MLTDFKWHFSVAVTRKIHQKTVMAQLKKIQMLGTSRRFADKSKAAAIGQRIYGAGFACIGPPGKSYFHSLGRRQAAQFVNSGIKRCMLKNRHIPIRARRRKSKKCILPLYREKNGLQRR